MAGARRTTPQSRCSSALGAAVTLPLMGALFLAGGEARANEAQPHPVAPPPPLEQAQGQLKQAVAGGGLNPRDVKLRLARELAVRFHGAADAEKAIAGWHAVVTGQGDTSLLELKEVSVPAEGIRIAALLTMAGITPAENPELWKQASPLTHAGAFTPPTLFINSSVARMHAGRNDFMQLLRNNNIYTDVKEFENSPHSFCLFEPWFTPTVEYIDTFLQNVFPKK